MWRAVVAGGPQLSSIRYLAYWRYSLSGTKLTMLGISLAVLAGCRQPSSDPAAQTVAPHDALPSCEWCGATEAPKELSWDTRIAASEEAGEPLVISGTVYTADGTRPASDVVLYLYHTNAEGVYPKRGDETGNGRRHGYLRAWLQSRDDGAYRFTTIKPATYPDRTEPAHIHIVVLEPGRPEYWIDSFMFEGDPLLTPEVRVRLQNRCGSGIVSLQRDDNGIWGGHRDITLER
jgi:protocatechuate 3,4-dioxygenase beta subunit